MSSNKQKKAELKARHERKAERELQKARTEGRVVDGKIIPAGALKADTTKQRSCSVGPWSPKPWYLDTEFRCKDCGKLEVWTAEQQKWWYEECGGIVESTAVRCRACRKKKKADAVQQKDAPDG